MHQTMRLFISLRSLKLLPTQTLALRLRQRQALSQEEPSVSSATEPNKPLLIQIDDLVREMTPEEEAAHEALIADSPALPNAG